MSSDFHGRIMDLTAGMVPKARDRASDYLLGHRDARHAAAEIASEADRRLEVAQRLAEALEECRACLQAHAKHTEDLIADMKATKALAEWEALKP